MVLTAYAADRNDVTPTCMQQPTGERTVHIRRVVDGDTVVDECNRKIRVLGIDTPEHDTADGPDATAFTRAWLAPATMPVTLSICKEQPTDHYGRLLARVQRGARDLSNDLLHHGWAWVMAIPPCGEAKISSDLAAMNQAAQQHLGLWSHAMTQPVSATDLPADAAYVMVQDRVIKVRKNKSTIQTHLGTLKTSVVLQTRRDRMPLFTKAGIDFDGLTGKTLRVQGKPYRKPGKPVRLYVDYPELLTIID